MYTHTHSLVETPSCLQHLMSYVPSKACHVQSFQANWCVSPNKKAQPALYVVQNRSRLPLAALCKSSLTQFVACPSSWAGDCLRLLGVDKTKDGLMALHCIFFFPRQSVMSMPNCIRQSVQCHILSGSLTNSKDSRPCTPLMITHAHITKKCKTPNKAWEVSTPILWESNGLPFFVLWNQQIYLSPRVFVTCSTRPIIQGKKLPQKQHFSTCPKKSANSNSC